MADKRETKRERTRQAIIESGYGLIIEQGYAGTSMRQIADAAGAVLDGRMALGSLYNYFPSKENLFIAILEEKHPFLEILPILNRTEGESLEQFVRNAARTLIDELGNHPGFLNLMLTEIVEFKAQHVHQVFEKFLPMIVPLVQHLTSLEGTLRPMPPLVLARAFLGMFLSYYITGILIGDAFPDMQENALNHFVDIFLYGILLEKTA
jgi:AcrR family transcriptional regulator